MNKAGGRPERVFELFGVNGLDGSFEDNLYDLYFGRDQLVIVDNGRRKTLCRVATGMVGITPETDPTPKNDVAAGSARPNTESAKYSDLAFIRLSGCYPTARGRTALAVGFANGKEKKFGIPTDECDTIRRQLERINGLSRLLSFE